MGRRAQGFKSLYCRWFTAAALSAKRIKHPPCAQCAVGRGFTHNNAITDQGMHGLIKQHLREACRFIQPDQVAADGAGACQKLQRAAVNAGIRQQAYLYIYTRTAV